MGHGTSQSFSTHKLYNHPYYSCYQSDYPEPHGHFVVGPLFGLKMMMDRSGQKHLSFQVFFREELYDD